MAMICRRIPRFRRGLTLVELMVTLTIGAILLALTVPQMREYIARKRVSGAATELIGDIRLARAMVMQENQPIWIHFGSTSTFTCYVLFTQGNLLEQCDCTRTLTPMCPSNHDSPVPLRSVFIQRDTGITLTSPARYVIYKQAVGAPSRLPASADIEAEVSGSVGGRIKVAMAGLTRATACSLEGHTAEFGDCP
jgi:prepilin-type N-terminal cleavage/methylation domain-containing protein